MSRFTFADLLLRNPAALVIVKATVVLALATAANAAAKHLFSAAVRHMVWLVSLASCVWLALSSPVAPAITIHTPMLAQSVVTTVEPPTAPARPRSRRTTVANTSRLQPPLSTIKPVRGSPARSIPVPSHPFIALWIIGCAALLVRHAVGFGGTARLARRATIAHDDEATRELAGVTASLGVKRDVHLGYSADVHSPITFDVATPYVLLPAEARSWSAERRRAVLVHEAAHIARGDWLAQMIGQVACELFWFHPLVWRAFARLRDEAERAADDCVLRSGMPACEYATHLLALAQRATDRTTSRPPALVAIGIVSAGDLERRFVAMFDHQRPRTAVTRRTRTITASFALAIACPLSSLRIAAPAQHRSAPPLHPSMPARASATPVAHEPAARTATLRQPAATQPQSLAAVVESAMPSPRAHPDLSGKWTTDTAASAVADVALNDSTIISQSNDAISLESRGSYDNLPTHARLPMVAFGGAQYPGVTSTGSQATNFVATAVWEADTLVIKSYIQSGGHDALTYERLVLSADGNTLLATNTSFVDGRNRWGGPLTFVLRRMMP